MFSPIRGPTFRWVVAVVVLGLAAVPLFARWSWFADLISILEGPAGVFATAAAIWWGIRRRWGPALVAASAAILSLWILGPGRAPRGSGVFAVRVLEWNADPLNSSPDEARRWIASQNPDIAVLVEMPGALVTPIMAEGLSEMTFREICAPLPEHHGWTAVLSRWPVRAESPPGTVPLIVRIDAPSGPLTMIALHASSPRSRKRWDIGNAQVQAAARAAGAATLPLLVAGDLNGTPASLRARMLRTAGLRPCKSLLVPAGTYPSGMIWPFQLAIDDVWVSSGWRVAGWQSIRGPGSDHRAVLATLAPPLRPVRLP